MSEIITGVAFERHAVVLMARVTGANRQAIVQSSLNKIFYEVWKIPTPQANRLPPDYAAYGDLSRSRDSTELTIGSVIFDTLQTDARWTVDTTGYNFLVELDAATFEEIPAADYPESQWYEIPIRFEPTSGAAFGVNYQIECKGFLYGKAPPDAE